MEKIRDHFTEPEMFRLREEFNDVDADRSGFIDEDELKVLLTLLNDGKVPSEAAVRRVLAEADQSGDGQLDFLEFLALVHNLKEEKKKNASHFNSAMLLLDTIKTDVFGGIIADAEKYSTMAKRYVYSDYYAKKERREAERDRIKAEKEAAKAKLESDRKELAAFDEAQAKKVAARTEETGLKSTVRRLLAREGDRGDDDESADAEHRL
jgi:hypothetical protein